MELINLETRSCPQCENKFKVMKTSNQIVCSRYCESKFTGHKRHWREDGRLIVKDITATSSIQIGSESTMSNVEDEGKKRQAKTDLVASEDIGPSEKKRSKEKKSGAKKMQSTSETTKETTTRRTSKESESRSTPTESRIIQTTDSQASLVDLNVETYHCLNLLSASNNELFRLMKELNQSNQDNEVKRVDVDRVRTAAECAKQIISGIRMQLDICKFKKEIEKT